MQCINRVCIIYMYVSVPSEHSHVTMYAKHAVTCKQSAKITLVLYDRLRQTNNPVSA